MRIQCTIYNTEEEQYRYNNNNSTACRSWTCPSRISGVAYRAAAATRCNDGWRSRAAARRDWEKRRTYGQLEPNGYPFIPFSIETYDRLGKPAISFLGQLGLEAKEAGRKVSKSGFVAAAIRELSVGLCRGNYQMYRSSLGLLARVSGRGFREGAAHPTEEVW
jgi:hypothetical protein